MARTSRRSCDAAACASRQEVLVYPTAIYARLSVENSGKDDNGTALENQIDVCREYIQGCPDLQLIKVYQDNGWTGTVMSWPAFDEMMGDVKSGVIKAIVVRDLSRFARNYIETGLFLERSLPELDVRFVSVKEGYDSLKTDGSNESLMVPLQNLINDLYSKDISRKVEAALHIQMEEEKFRWRRIPYGYKWNDDHTNIVPDEVTAPVVRQIFQWCAEGVSKDKIARKLDEMKVPRYTDDCAVKAVNPWSTGVVSGILSNPAYIGKRVYGRRHSALYKGIRLERKPEKDWYVIENAHDSLVDRELYEKVSSDRSMNRDRRNASMEKTRKDRARLVDLFEGKIFCADCGYRMYFHRHRMDKKGKPWYANYYCSTSQIHRNISCTGHYIRQTVLDEKVLDAIKLQAKVAMDYEKLIGQIRRTDKDSTLRDVLNNRIRSLSIRVQALQKKRSRLYEDYAEGILDASEYTYAKAEYDREYERLNTELESLVGYRNDCMEAMSSDNKWVRMMKGVGMKKKLSKELVDSIVEKVLVHEGEGIEILMKYRDVYDLTTECLDKIKEAENG